MRKLILIVGLFWMNWMVESAPICELNFTSMADYNRTRNDILAVHRLRGLGFTEILTEREIRLNEILMKLKRAELEQGFANPHNFTAARHFFDVIKEVNDSPLFQLIKKMPKGAVLHAHDTALASTDYVVSLTYRKNLWQCGLTPNIEEFLFSARMPAKSPGCVWLLVSSERNRLGKTVYDAHVRSLFTLFNERHNEVYDDINYMWAKFEDVFSKLAPIVTYVPVWKDYFYQSLKEFYEDGVQLLEFRGILPELYDLDGRIYGPEEVVEMYIETLEKFKMDNPGFIDAKFIYAPHRLVDDQIFDSYLEILKNLRAKFPDFVVGFDLVGQEDLGRPLISFVERLLKLKKINFYFHAGETNWNGMLTDQNVIDAVLLRSKRIGHGYALTKYPILLDMVRQQNICIEVNPMSNQILKLVRDYRNHPASLFFADNYPIVITSDNPSFWEATPLSHDMYFAFLGIASADQDLRTLKRLILNSIKYSSLTVDEKIRAENKWLIEWNKFVNSNI